MSDNLTDRLFGLNLSRMSDDRREILERFSGTSRPTREDNETLTRALSAIRLTVASRKRTEIRGLGVFTWKPFHAHLPNGKNVVTRRLWFSSTCIRRGSK